MFDSIIILGPTATGKTNLAISLAKALDTEIVNADSMYLYKYFNIGTAKPTNEELKEVKHHLVDFLEPTINYSVANYRDDAKEAIAKIRERNKIPIVVGGTGFYIDSLIKSFSYGNSEKNIDLRNELLIEKEKFGNDYLYEKLKSIDEQSAFKLHKNDTKRIIRAIEIALSGNSKKSQLANNSEIILKAPLIIGLNLDREILYGRINARVDIMIESGLLDEVKNLYNKGFTPENCNAMKGIGYKEIVSYFRGEYSLEEAIDKIKQHTRNYAKRQITWFKRNSDIIWLNPINSDLTKDVLKLFSK